MKSSSSASKSSDVIIIRMLQILVALAVVIYVAIALHSPGVPQDFGTKFQAADYLRNVIEGRFPNQTVKWLDGEVHDHVQQRTAENGNVTFSGSIPIAVDGRNFIIEAKCRKQNGKFWKLLQYRQKNERSPAETSN